MDYGFPERRLMLAVLEDAIRNLLLAKRAAISPRRVREDMAWFESVDRSDPFTFESVCDALGIDPDWLRGRLLAGALPARGKLRRSTRLSPGRPDRSCSVSF
jgi:hypothetical protein